MAVVQSRSRAEDTSEDTVLLLPGQEFGSMFGKNENGLKFSQRVAYGVGHVMNDICSAMWFSYTLLFFEVVLEMPSIVAGSLIFVGQVADAVASPIIGILVDRYGTRKSWHMIGTALIAFSFSLIFSKCPWGPDSSPGELDWLDTESWSNSTTTEVALGALYYSVLVTIFQVGWATVQIAHLAIIPEMTPDKCGRADLTAIRKNGLQNHNNIVHSSTILQLGRAFGGIEGPIPQGLDLDSPNYRYMATVGSSVFVYLVTWFVLHVTDENKGSLGPKDGFKFKDVVLAGLLTGGVFTIWFHAVLDTPNEVKVSEKAPATTSATSWFSVIKPYFKSWRLYQVTLVYFTSRMVLNISLVYMPLYLLESAGDETEYIATVPLVSYLASFLASLAVKQVRSFCDSKISYFVGTLICIGVSTWIGIGLVYPGELFGVSSLLGAGSSITGVASLCLCADLIGEDTENGAFVYSIVTAVDKLLGGIAVIVIEKFKSEPLDESSHYYQNTLAYGCGISSVVGLIALFTMCRYKEKKPTESPSDSRQA